MKMFGRGVWYRTDMSDGFYAEMRWEAYPWWRQWWRRLTRWEPCRTYWGSHGCDRPRGHRGRHRCGGILRDRCGHGYLAPPWWAPWRTDETHYYGEDVPGWEPLT